MSNFSAYSPDVPGCVASGATVEKTLQQMQQALALHIDGIVEDGDELPRAQGLSHYVSNDELEVGPNDLITHMNVQLPAVA